jgi:integrase/recombinase XerC
MQQEELLQRYINFLEAEKHASPYTVRNYTSDLCGNLKRGTPKGFFQYLELRQINNLNEVNRHTLRDYLAYLMQQGVAKVSLARKVSAVRSFYRFLVREGVITENPIEAAVSPKLDKRLPQVLTIEETIRLIQAPDITVPHGLRDRAIIELIYAAGLRVSELTGLVLNQIDLNTREIRVLGKGNKERIVIIGQPAIQALEAYLSDGRPVLLGKHKTQAVFINRYGGRLTERMVQKMLVKYGVKAEIDKKIHPHLLRHSFATHMLDGGADLRVVQELLGHANLATTQIYTHVSHNQARRVYMASHPMAKLNISEGNANADNNTKKA